MNQASKNNGNLTLEEKRALLAQLLQKKASESECVDSLSWGQQALWFLCQMTPESGAYNIAYAVRVRSELDIPALQRALQILTERHASLRTTYTTRNGQPVQNIHPHSKVDIEVTDVSTWSDDDLKQRLAKAVDRPFDLERGTVLRVNLFTRSAQEHTLLLTVHHIVSDLWSLMVLMDELGVLYAAQKTGRPASLPPLSLRYLDYVHWQSEMLAGAEGERLWTYWQKQLSGSLPVLNLPTARPRPPIQTYRGASQTFHLNEELKERLKTLAKTEGATLFTTLLAAFFVLLYRYTNQEDILVGSPTSGRSRAGFAGIVGYFANPVVLRANLSENPTFQEFLSQVRTTVMGAIAHQDYPFPLLVERLQPDRDLSRSPLFQASFVLQKPQRFGQILDLLAPSETESRVNWGGLELEPLEIPHQGDPFDLTLEMIEVKESLFGVFKYNTDLFDAVTITQMVGHFQTLLETIVTNPQQQISQLPLLTTSERHRLLVEWNDTQLEYPHDQCIHQLFESQVERTPDAVAAVFEESALTYRQLNSRANQLAHHLQALGVGAEVLVGICVERSLNMLVGLLGILKAGGTYVPLDPAYPQERLSFMLEDSQAPVLLTQQRLVTLLPTNGTHVVCLDADWEAIAQNSQTNPTSNVTSNNLAYAIYTSGSTGKPKGVQVLHRGVVNFLTSMRRCPGLTEQDTLLSVTTLSFDIAALELFLPLIVGARVVLVSREVAADGTQLLQRLKNCGVTLMQATPATWRLLLAAGWSGSPQLKILCGGEALSRELANQLLSKGASLWNLYGPTEATIWSTISQVDNSDGSVSIGRPIANTQIYLLDEQLQPVPVGVPGELYIGGAGLARGYLNRPELTAQRFIAHPLSNEANARLYKTGDLARYLPDGNIEYLARIDHQVKLRGFRIELGEIEAVLSQQPVVQQGVVVVRDDSPGNQQLVAYLVPHPEQAAPTASELRHFLKQQLPEYMVPSAFVTLDSLPLTPNGKVDRRALPSPEGLRPDLAAAYVAPRTELEQTIATVWQEVLRVEQVGMHDNFFDLGGHSLLVVQVHNKLQEILKRNFLMTEMFKYPTISSLVEYLTPKQAEQAPLQQSQKRLEMRRKSIERRKNPNLTKSL